MASHSDSRWRRRLHFMLPSVHPVAVCIGFAAVKSLAYPCSHTASSTCCCSDTGKCDCWTPRRSAPWPRRKAQSAATRPRALVNPVIATPADGTTTPPEQSAVVITGAPCSPASHILARISELRPVLPRPSSQHDPSSSTIHAHPNRHHHESSFFSPYGRAYDINHHPHHLPHITAADHLALTSSSKPLASSIPPSPPPTTINVALPSSCCCGDGCSCPGCSHHNNNAPFTSSSAAYPTCQNPSTCHACLDCTILSLPPSAALSIPDPQQEEVIDQWIRQMSSGAVWDDDEVQRQQPYSAAGVTDKPTRTPPQSSAAPADMIASLNFPTFTATNENAFMSDVAAFQSRSPHSGDDNQFSSHLFSGATGSDRLPAPQQSMYINGRGFYSDPYLSPSDSSGGGDGFASTVFLPPSTSVTDFDVTHQHLQQQDEASVTYAISNPDSDTSSTSFESSGDEHSMFGDGSAPSLQSSSSFQGNKHHSLSVSPVSFENRTLY